MLQLVLKHLSSHYDRPNAPPPVKFIHELQRLNELQNLIPLAIQHQLPETKAARVQKSSWAKNQVNYEVEFAGLTTRLPEEEHVVRVQPVDDAALLLQRQHADMQLPGVEKVQDDLNDLHLLHVDGFFRCHGDDGLPTITAEMLKTFRHLQEKKKNPEVLFNAKFMTKTWGPAKQKHNKDE